MVKLADLCINVEETNDNFVGIKYNKDKINIIFPLGYNIPKDNDKECRKSVMNLFKTISLTHEKNYDYSNDDQIQQDNNDLPINSYIWMLSDYIENGLYSDNEKVYKQQQNGKINWKKTFKTKFLISNNSLVYLNPIVEQNSNIKNIITEIHSYCVDKSIDIIGPLFNGISKLNFINADINRINYYIQLIDKEKLRTFDDRKKMLLYHMRLILLEQINNGSNQIRQFGTKHYEYIWEYMINKVLGDKEIDKYYPTTNYYINNRRPYMPSKLRPDTIFVYNDNFYILDSKYYKFGVTSLNKDLPNSDSIQKQVTYGEFVNNNFNLDKKYKNIYNAFIIPYNKLKNHFESNSNINYCGYAICNWKLNKQYNHKYLKVAIILLDTKFLIDSFFLKTGNIKELLSNQIDFNKL